MRHPTNPILVLVAGKEIIGQEVWEDDIARFHADPNVIFLGKGFVVFRDKLNSAGENRPRFEYRAQRFPELETIENISEVVSATVSSDTDIYIKRKAKWDVNDASMGTVMIGFNFSGN